MGNIPAKGSGPVLPTADKLAMEREQSDAVAFLTGARDHSLWVSIPL